MGFPSPGAFSTGPQQIVVITNPNLNIGPLILQLDGRREKFSSKFDDEVLQDEPCDNGGVIDLVYLPKTVSGTISGVRQSDNFSAVMTALQAGFFQGASDTGFTIQSEEPATDGSGEMAIYTYVNVHFHGLERGEWSRNSPVKWSVNFIGSFVQKTQ